ncbi:MAG: division/cell wall cluster transcriptional repressor MraZ [Cellulophaga sp.]
MDSYFSGTYNCKADAKGRVMLPVALKKKVDSILEEGFVIKISFYENCLELHPVSSWNAIMVELNSKNKFDPEVLSFIRKYTAGLRPVEIDGAGRLLISKSLVSEVGISKNVVLADMGEFIEIWDKELYDGVVKGTKEENMALARKVMLTEKSKNELS